MNPRGSERSQLIIERAKVKGFRFLHNARKLSSQYDPIKEGENLVAEHRDQLKKNPEIKEVIALGFFPIYHLHLLREINPELMIRVIEETPIPQKDLYRAWERVEETYLLSNNSPKKVTPTFHSEIDHVIDYLNQMDSEMLKKIILIPSPYASREMVAKVFSVYRELWNKSSVVKKTTDYFEFLWNLHTLINLKQGEGMGIDSITWGNDDSTLTSRSVFLISSGPSLDNVLNEHAEAIIRLAKQYPFIAVPGIARRLLDSGIPLAAILATDAGFANTYHFGKLLDYREDLPVIVPLSIHPGIVRCWERIFFYWDMEEHARWFIPTLGKKNYVPGDASVVLSALRVLFQLGCRRIHTIGIDFSMTPFKEHAHSNTTQEILFSRSRRLVNYTTMIHTIYHKQILFQKDKQEYQNQSLHLYQQQFEKIKNKFLKMGIELTPINSLPWQEYLIGSGSALKFKTQSPDKKKFSRKIYDQVHERFKAEMFPSWVSDNSNSLNDSNPINDGVSHIPKEIWLNDRWERL